MATKVYYQRDFDKIIHDGVSFAIPADVLQRIMDLEAKMKVKAAATSHSYEARSGHRAPMKGPGRGGVPRAPRRPEAETESWERGQTESEASAPPPKKKVDTESKEAIVQRILVCLNKISKANFDTQLAEIRKALQEMDSGDREAGLAEVLTVCTRVQTMVPMYADLWFRLATEPETREEEEEDAHADEGAKPTYLPCREVFEQRLDVFQASFSDIVYVDPEKDNDGFCLYTKKNTQRRAMTVFLTELVKKGLVSWEIYLDCVEFMVGKVVGWVQNVSENRRNELEEVSENLFLTLSANAVPEEEEEAARWEKVWEQVATLSQTVVRDFPNMTSRSKFKYQDLIKLRK